MIKNLVIAALLLMNPALAENLVEVGDKPFGTYPVVYEWGVIQSDEPNRGEQPPIRVIVMLPSEYLDYLQKK